MVTVDKDICLHLHLSYVIAVAQNEPGTDECWQSKLSHVWVTEFHIRFSLLCPSMMSIMLMLLGKIQLVALFAYDNTFNRTSRSVSPLVVECIFSVVIWLLKCLPFISLRLLSKMLLQFTLLPLGGSSPLSDCCLNSFLWQWGTDGKLSFHWDGEKGWIILQYNV